MDETFDGNDRRSPAKLVCGDEKDGIGNPEERTEVKGVHRDGVCRAVSRQTEHTCASRTM